MIRFLNGIAGWRHHSQVRNSPWTMFFNGVHATKIVTAAPFRKQSSASPFLPPQAARSAKLVFFYYLPRPVSAMSRAVLKFARQASLFEQATRP